MMSSGLQLCIARSRSASRPWRSPSTMRWASRSSSFSGRPFFSLLGRAVLEQRDKGVQRVVASRRRSKIRSSAIRSSSGGMLCNGMIREKCTIAPVSPRRSAWSRKTEFRICRAGGFSPKEMFDRPRMIWHSGIARAIRSIASKVLRPSLRSSSLPVQIVKVSGSNSRSEGGNPCLTQAKS